MKRITILSDTHGCLDKSILKHISDCDEVWHAGDIGSIKIYDQISQIKQLKAVYGNIDDHNIRTVCPKTEIFLCEDVKVMMRHICGYPGRYDKKALDKIRNEKPKLVIAGHSHILKVIYDKHHDHLHINPGAAGKKGLHHIRTLVHLVIDGSVMKDLEVVELGARGSY